MRGENTHPDTSTKEITTYCSLRNFAITLIMLLIIGIMIWMLAPFEHVIDAVLPQFNGTESTRGNDSGNETENRSDGDGESASSPLGLQSNFTFNQCRPLVPCCNGLESICDLRVNEVMFASVHNAMATRADGFLFVPNHLYELEKALEAGYRSINLDVCNCGGELQFCHGVCGLGSRDITEVFLNINRFLQDNPSEVLLLSFELNSVVDEEVLLSDFYAKMQGVDGFTNRIYAHNDTLKNWPTFNSLIGNDQRMVIFHYNGQTCNDDSCPPGLNYYWDYATETEFDILDVETLNDTSYSCRITRGDSGSNAFFGVNNFVNVPNQGTAAVINSLEYAGDRIKKCSEYNGGLDVNLLSVDFWSIGSIPELVQGLNHELGIKRQRKIRRRLYDSIN